MSNLKLAPRLRFPEFYDEWQTKRLDEIATFSKGGGISKLDISADGKIEAIRYGELYTIYGETITKVMSKTHLDSKTLVFSRANDVIIPASGETSIDIATASCVLRSGIALSGDINIIRSSESGTFLAYYFNSRKKHDIARLAQGVSIVHLYGSSLKTLKLNLPSLDEQKMIADALTLIDERIAATDRKIELLKQYKKAAMQKTFTQQIRFKDKNGNDYPDWQTQQVSEIAQSETSPLAANQIEHRSGKYKVYGASGVLQTLDEYHYEHEYIAIVKDGAGVGRISLCEARSSVLGTMIVIQPRPGIDKKFLYYLISLIDFKKYTTGSTIPHIYFKQYSKEKFYVPSYEEQGKIASFLTTIDDKIKFKEAKLDTAKRYKKYLLQKMFV